MFKHLNIFNKPMFRAQYDLDLIIHQNNLVYEIAQNKQFFSSESAKFEEKFMIYLLTDSHHARYV